MPQRLRLPWYHGWNILAIAMLFQAVTFGIGIYCFTFFVQPLTAEFEVGRGRVMWLFVTLQIAMGAASPFAGQAMDRVNLRVLVCIGLCCIAAALWLMAQATALWQVQLCFGTLMVGSLLLAGPLAAQTLATRWFDRRRGLALGLSTVGTSIGGFVVPLIFATLLEGYGWRGAAERLALLVLVLVLPPVWLLVRSSPAAMGLAGEGGAPGAPASAAAAVTSWHTGSILRSRAFQIIVLAFLPLAIAFGAAQQNLGPLAADQGLAPSTAATLVSVLALTMIGAKICFGALADRVDHRWLFLTAVGACVLALLQMSGSLSYSRLLVVSMLLGGAAGGFLPLLGAVVSARFGVAAFGRVMGLVGPFTTMAALGPWLAARLRDSTGSYDAAWPLMLGFLAVAAVAIYFLPAPDDGPAGT